MKAAERELRQQVIATGRQLETLGLNPGTSGKVSVRCGAGLPAGFLLTPARLAGLYCQALAAGKPAILSDRETMTVVAKFREFGCGPVPSA